MQRKQLNTNTVLRNQIINSAISGICFFVLLATAFSCLFLAGIGIFFSITLTVPLFISAPTLGFLFGFSFIIAGFAAYALAITVSTIFGLENKSVRNKLSEIKTEIHGKKLNITIVKSTLSRKLAFLDQLKNVSLSDSDEEEELPMVIKNLLTDILTGFNDLQKYLSASCAVVNQFANTVKLDFSTAKEYNNVIQSINDANQFLIKTREYIRKYLSHFVQTNNQELKLINNIDWVIENKLQSLQPRDNSPLLINNNSID